MRRSRGAAGADLVSLEPHPAICPSERPSVGPAPASFGLRDGGFDLNADLRR
jgi:hypothetical protein